MWAFRFATNCPVQIQRFPHPVPGSRCVGYSEQVDTGLTQMRVLRGLTTWPHRESACLAGTKHRFQSTYFQTTCDGTCLWSLHLEVGDRRIGGQCYITSLRSVRVW